MSNNFRVFNITTGATLKFKQAQKHVEDCTLAWANEEQTQVRNLTLQESIAARNEQAKHRAPLASAELPGIKWQPPVSDAPFRNEHNLALRAAYEFAAGV